MMEIDDALARFRALDPRDQVGPAYRKFFDEHGIAPEKRDPSHDVCSIGFSEKEQKWYGWSHRAIYGFGIGSKVTRGHIAYDDKRGAWKAKTLDDAKQMAIDFAAGVA